jgi:hypothetical protein
MSNKLESDIAMAPGDLELLEPMVLKLVTMPVRPRRRDRAAKFDTPAVRIMFQVTQIARFLLERGLRSCDLGFRGHASG